jgi:hypothetical protein
LRYEGEIWKVLSNRVHILLHVTLEHVETKEKKTLSYLLNKERNVFILYPFDYKEENLVVSKIEENEDYEYIEIFFETSFSIRVLYSKICFDFLQFFRRRRGNKVVLKFVDLMKKFRILGWEYK